MSENWRACLSDFIKRATLLLFLVFLAVVFCYPFLYLLQMFLSEIYHLKTGPKETYESIRNLGLIVAAFIGFGLVLWRHTILNHQAKIAEKRAGIADEQQYSDLYIKSVELLGTTNPKKERNIEVCQGAVHALGAVSYYSTKKSIAVIETLATFIRGNAPEDGEVWEADIKAAMIIIGTRDARLMREGDAKEIKLDFQGVNFAGQYLNGINFSNANLKKSNFSKADLTSANMSRAELQETILNETVLERTNLSGAKFFDEGDSVTINFSGANLSGANLSGVTILDEANFSGANLSGGAKLNGTHLNASIFSGAKFMGAEFIDAELENAIFSGSYTNGTKADFTGAFLKGANFTNATLEDAVFRNANMTGAIFKDTDLRGADLSGAILKGRGEQSGTDLSGARNLTEEQIESAIGNSGTELPHGFERPECWRD